MDKTYEEIQKEYASGIGRKGGQRTRQRYGRNHFVTMRLYGGLKRAGCVCPYKEIGKGYIDTGVWQHQPTCPLKPLEAKQKESYGEILGS